jgi:hypothetical protein
LTWQAGQVATPAHAIFEEVKPMPLPDPQSMHTQNMDIQSVVDNSGILFVV